MRIEARITEVTIPIARDKNLAKIGIKVEYRTIDHEGKHGRWLFHSIHLDSDLAEYVKNGIEDQSIPVLYERHR